MFRKHVNRNQGRNNILIIILRKIWIHECRTQIFGDMFQIRDATGGRVGGMPARPDFTLPPGLDRWCRAKSTPVPDPSGAPQPDRAPALDSISIQSEKKYKTFIKLAKTKIAHSGHTIKNRMNRRHRESWCCAVLWARLPQPRRRCSCNLARHALLPPTEPIATRASFTLGGEVEVDSGGRGKGDGMGGQRGEERREEATGTGEIERCACAQHRRRRALLRRRRAWCGREGDGDGGD